MNLHLTNPELIGIAVVAIILAMSAGTAFAAGAGPATDLLSGQTPAPVTHRLEATPDTVAYGYYWSEAKPALRIASGDIIDVDTLLTNSPNGLQSAGVPPEKVQDSLRKIVTEVLLMRSITAESILEQL